MKKSITILSVLLITTLAIVQHTVAQTPSLITDKSFGQLTTSDVKDVLLDNNGNAYAWGVNNYYYYLIKYNANGIEQWRLNGVNNNSAGNGSYDFNSTIEDLIIDASGNCYFTGFGYNPALGNRMWLTKVATNGTISWSISDTTSSYVTTGYAISFDQSGNPIVAGTRNESGCKVHVAKYNKTTGALIWGKLHEFVTGQCENIAAIAADTIGNIYVCGDAYKDGTARQNIYVLKLSSAGNQVWLKDYDGNSNNDYAKSLYVNKAGTIIYATGYGYFGTTGYDWEIIKYDGPGNQQWAKNIDGGSNTNDYLQSFAVDNNGNIFAAGQQVVPAVGNIYSILKLNPTNGNTTATAQEGEPASTNYPIDIAIDSANRVYASYSDYDVMIASRFSNGLVKQWSWYDVNNYCYGTAIAARNNGETFITGKNYYSTEPSKIVKTDANGNETWSNIIKTEYTGGQDYLYDYVVDNNGSIYAAGYAYDAGNMVVYRLDRNGEIVWKNYFNTNSFHAYDIKYDAANNAVYVCGSRGNYMGLVKYNATTGATVWGASYNAPGSGQDVAYELDYDNSGNIYITGKGIKSTAEAGNIYTLKYSPNGARLWVADFTGAPGVNSDDYANAIDVDNSGNVYVAGAAVVTNKNYEFTVLKYNTNGVLQYSKLLSGGNFNNADEAYDIVVDNSGNAYVGGYYYSSSPEYYEAVVVKINSAGTVDFTKKYNGLTTLGTFETVYKLCLNGTNLIATGIERKDAVVYDTDVFTVRLSTSGTQSWIKFYENTNNTALYNYGFDVYADSRGNVYSLSVQDTLWTLIKYDSLGTQLWLYNYDRNFSQNPTYPYYDYRPFMAFDNYGAVYIGGTSYKAYSGYNHTFIKFCEYPPVPAVTASGPLTFCAGGSVTLTAASGIGYQWSNGSSTQAININSSGNYTATVSYTNGCSNNSAKKTVTVNANPTPVITPTGSTTFCDGGSVTLGTTSYSSYLWNNGATSQSIIVDTTGNYRVTVSNANGCTGSSTSVATTENPLPNATITVTGSTTFCAGDSVKFTANSGTGLTYQWRKNGTNVSGATNKIYYAKTQGTYTVRVTNTNGCSKISTGVQVIVNCKLMLPEIANAQMNVYPNPTSGTMHLQASGIEKQAILKVYDATGKLVFEKHFDTNLGDLNYDMDLSSYQQGLYRFEILSGSAVLYKQAFKID